MCILFGQRIVAVLGIIIAHAALAADAPVAVPQVIRSYPHDTSAFTQGLVWNGGLLYESTGNFGHSVLMVRELETGRVLHRHALPPEMFGEGIALVDGEIIQLTWKNHWAFVYDKTDLRLKRTLPYAWEGWGLTYDGQHLIASDGSARLRFLDPASLQEIRSIEVHDGDQPIDRLNALEYVRGEILANVFETDRIVRIAPATGQVIAWLDLSGLFPAPQRTDREDVLNGIAYDPVRHILLVTGKKWPKLFAIPAPHRDAHAVDAFPFSSAKYRRSQSRKKGISSYR